MLTTQFIKIGIKKQVQYKLNFLFLCIAVAPIHLIQLLFSWIIVKEFGGVAGWSFWELSFLYAVLLTSYSIAQIFFRQFRSIDNLIVSGGLDKYFIQPLSIAYNLIFSQLNLMEVISQLLPSVIVLIVTCIKLNIVWNFCRIVMLIIAIVAGTAIQACIFCLIGFISFWTVKSVVFEDLFYTFKDFLNYPLSIYSKYIRGGLTYILPLAFVNYYPVLYILYKKEAENSILPFLSPLVAFILVVLTVCISKRAFKNYSSTGS
jgi:ABC-2 type transport system permease protein